MARKGKGDVEEVTSPLKQATTNYDQTDKNPKRDKALAVQVFVKEKPMGGDGGGDRKFYKNGF
jgi:hypothetical protein